MQIILNHSSIILIHEQLVEQIKNSIMSGESKEGSVLPSVRALSAELKISALTVKKAYDKLEEEGFVKTIHGKGTFVSAADHQMAIEAKRKAVEDDFHNAIQRAKQIGLMYDEIREMFEIMLEEE